MTELARKPRGWRSRRRIRDPSGSRDEVPAVAEECLAGIVEALQQYPGCPRVPVRMARAGWAPLRVWSYGMVRDDEGQATILLEPRLLKLGREAVEATIAHELGHVALGHVDPAHRFDCRFGERWTMRDEALAAFSWATMLLVVPGGLAFLVAGRSLAALIAPVVLTVAVNVLFAAGRAPARHHDEYEADAYAVRLLGQCESTLALLTEFAHQRERRRSRLTPPMAGPHRRSLERPNRHAPNAERAHRAHQALTGGPRDARVGRFSVPILPRARSWA